MVSERQTGVLTAHKHVTPWIKCDIERMAEVWIGDRVIPNRDVPECVLTFIVPNASEADFLAVLLEGISHIQVPVRSETMVTQFSRFDQKSKPPRPFQDAAAVIVSQRFRERWH